MGGAAPVTHGVDQQRVCLRSHHSAGLRYRIVGLGDDSVRPFDTRRRGPNAPLIDQL